MGNQSHTRRTRFVGSPTENYKKQKKNVEKIKELPCISLITVGLSLAVGGACLLLLLLGSSFYVHACHPRDILYAHWVCRVFNGP
jgi:hypothetical protein